MSYHFGFSWKGLIVFLLPMIPNLFYLLIPQTDRLGNKGNSHLLLDILEHGSQVIFIFLIIFLVNKQTSEMIGPYTIGMAVMLAFYLVLWIFYIMGNVNIIFLLGMAIVPVVYFILAELWLHNYIAIIPTVIFGIVHVIITCIDL
ncbi:hypothetical protein [Robertmurraya kyonggiensis]|uniref:Uncharacterized protein n=1 Tax=Robertmurraya kyonggiensis TaxID=1037680 RepID=A0A4U1D5P7_9BACI|nr:hypothetical protein [Robertmurraya kyonggiensis]TKC16356.1 hypothetical protein FA727_15520 [Robertmurraya kyonggiensis]